VTITKNSESLTLLCVNCGCQVRAVGLGWMHLDRTTRCLGWSVSGTLRVATPTLWTETECGEPF
jgi:hypothetical protein